MKKSHRTALLVGGGLAAAGVVGYLVYAHNKQQAAASSAVPPPLPGAPKAAGANVTNLTLSPGQMSNVPLSSASSDALSLFAPAGGVLGNATVSQTGQSLVSPTSGAGYEYVANAAGTATITVSYTDSTGATQTSTIPVTVS